MRIRPPPRGRGRGKQFGQGRSGCASRLEVTAPAGALISQRAARPAQRRQTPGILPGSLPPSRVESLPSPATEHLRTPSAPMYPAAGPHREHSSNVGGSGRRHTPTVHDRLESLITLRGIRTRGALCKSAGTVDPRSRTHGAPARPGGHLKLPHPWPGQNPPLDNGGMSG